jgi:hypothetical protein
MVRSNRIPITPNSGDGSPQFDPTHLSVAMEIINRQRQEQFRRAATRDSRGTGRFVDPTTCEKDHTENEMEFISAMQRYQQTSGRKFPTWSEVLEVVTTLGYQKPVSDGG